MPVSAVFQSVLAGNSTQPMNISFYVQQRLMKYHNVNAWNIGRAHDFFAPRQTAILWAAKYQKLFSVSNASQTSSLAGIVCITITTNTTTSVSPVYICIRLWPCCAACATCSNMQVSACLFMAAWGKWVHVLFWWYTKNPLSIWDNQFLAVLIKWLDECFWEEAAEFLLVEVHT